MKLVYIAVKNTRPTRLKSFTNCGYGVNNVCVLCLDNAVYPIISAGTSLGANASIIGTGFNIYYQSGNITGVVQTDTKKYTVVFPHVHNELTSNYLLTWETDFALKLFKNGSMVAEDKHPKGINNKASYENDYFTFLSDTNESTSFLMGQFYQFKVWRTPLDIVKLKEIYNVYGKNILLF